MKKQFTILLISVFILSLLALLSLLNKDSNFPKQEKGSPVLFMEKVFNSKTCEEFLSFFSDEMKILVADEIGSNNVENCNKELEKNVKEFNISSCREINKEHLNLNRINLETDMPIFSNVVYCEKEEFSFFLNYNELDKIYKIVNMGNDIKEETILKKEEEEIKNQEIESRKNTSNPAYKISPKAFVIDEENIISELPDDNKSVWVEEIVDENTIIVSYIILKGNENIITFATVNLYGLKNLSGCHKDEAIKFLKQFIEHKYVYLDGGYNSFPRNDYSKIPKYVKIPNKFLLKYVSILKEDVNILSVFDLNKDKKNEEKIEVNSTMVYFGYGESMVPPNMPVRLFENYYAHTSQSIQLRIKLENIQEVAKVAKRGFWADGVCE